VNLFFHFLVCFPGRNIKKKQKKPTKQNNNDNNNNKHQKTTKQFENLSFEFFYFLLHTHSEGEWKRKH